MDVKITTKVSSDSLRTCDVSGCSFRTTEDVSEGINHYITSHGYSLLHVGQETTTGYDGKPHQTTIAVLGK
jgi:hypothetical protein